MAKSILEGFALGPWTHEDVPQDPFEDPETGLMLLIARVVHSGHLVGYVLLPQGSPEHLALQVRLYEDRTYENVFDVHGGVTYFDVLRHVPGWFAVGFDCAHFSDLVPSNPRSGGTYRDLNFVKNQCSYLAAQVRKWLDNHFKSMRR